MDRAEASALADLKMHWGEVYAIGYEDGTWSAYYRGTSDEFRAASASDLRELIRADSQDRQRQLPRDSYAGLTERMST
jgi:hypothetical protein